MAKKNGSPRKYDHKKIVELYDEGLELQEIADQIGCSASLASIVVTKTDRSPFLRRYPHRANVDNNAMLEDYQAGMPLEELCKKHHLDSSRVHQLRQEADIPLRSRPSMTGENNYQYKHGLGNRRKERHPELTKQVAAICLGHIVPRGWLVHHMDENPGNNHPENLAIFPSKSTHAHYHQVLLKSQHEGLEVDTIQLVLENGGWMLPLPDHPIVLPREKDRLDPRKKKVKPKQGQS